MCPARSLIVYAFLIAAGCGAPAEESPQTREDGPLVTGRTLNADGTPAAGATVLIYHALHVSEETGEAEEGTRWVKSRLDCDDDGRFRIRPGGFRLLKLVAKTESAPGQASEPVLARPGDDVVLHLP